MRLNILCAFSCKLAIALLLTGCTEEERLFGPGEDTLRISATITPSAATRMQMGDKGNEQFQPGDRISLQVTPQDLHLAGRIPYTLQLTSNGWLPALTWTEIGSPRARFTAFYPAQPAQDAETFTHSVAIDQRKAENFFASDLLVASVEADRGTPVTLSFQHRLSLIKLSLSSAHTFSTEQLAQATVQVHACLTVTVDTSSGALLATDTQMPAEDILFHPTREAVYYVVLPPQTIRDAWRQQGWIEISVGGEIFTYRAPQQLEGGEAFTALMPGQQLTLRLKLDKNQPVDDWANKTVWTYGLKDIPTTDKWGYAFDVPKDGKHYSTLGLKWKKDYGWYDCNKVNPLYPPQGDSEMCWAAAASNMIYWWLDQNKEYVERFAYTGPKEYLNALQCEVFEHYKKAFPNKGGHVYEALDWFFTGRPIEEAKPDVEHGFFKAVLGENAKIASYVPVVQGSTFTETLKQAFRSQQAIECNLSYKGGYLHAINIWGAKFDEKGDVTHIYITDNNDRDLGSQEEHPFLDSFLTQAGILEKAVRYTPNGVFMESSTPEDFSMEIIQLCTLGLQQEAWKSYFDRYISYPTQKCMDAR